MEGLHPRSSVIFRLAATEHVTQNASSATSTGPVIFAATAGRYETNCQPTAATTRWAAIASIGTRDLAKPH
jgi:hypothetical protein